MWTPSCGGGARVLGIAGSCDGWFDALPAHLPLVMYCCLVGGCAGNGGDCMAIESSPTLLIPRLSFMVLRSEFVLSEIQ
jgi:hypothetical protein